METQLHFYCHHCRRWHHHGRGGIEAPFTLGRGGMAGHRSPHCLAENSPFLASGYILDVVGKADLSNILKKHNEQETLLCPECHKYYSAAYNACGCGYVRDSKPIYPELADAYQQTAFQTEQGKGKTFQPKTRTNINFNNIDQSGSSNPQAVQHGNIVNRHGTDRSTKPSIDDKAPGLDHELLSFINNLGEWVAEKEMEQKGFKYWFQIEIGNKFPEFREWFNNTVPPFSSITSTNASESFCEPPFTKLALPP